MVGILITFLLAVGFGLIGFASGYKFLTWFGVSLGTQFVIFFIFNSVMKALIQLRLNKLEVERLNKLDENRVRIKCSVCDDINDIIIKIGDVNEFRCLKCKSLNKVNIDISNHQKTEISPDGVLTEAFVEKMREKNGG